MQQILVLIKIISWSQLALIIALLLVSYGLKIYNYYKKIWCERARINLIRLLTHSMQHPSDFDPRCLRSYKRYNALLITTLNDFDVLYPNPNWQVIRQTIIDAIILPAARRLAQSHQWYKRFLACKSFNLSLVEADFPLVNKLLHDQTPLVAINACALAIQSHSQVLIDTMIDSLTTSRRVQESLYVQLISQANKALIPLIKNRLEQEANPYIKACCYRLLTSTPYHVPNLTTTANDLKTDNLNLKLSTMAFLAKNQPIKAEKILQDLLSDSHWEVRARAAKLLGKIDNISCLDKLDDCLRDPEWWVRFRAAEALAALGKPGIAILKKQKPTIDRYAYEVSQQVLFTAQHENLTD